MSDVLYENLIKFNILGEELQLVSEEESIHYSRNTVAIYNNKNYYLGDEYANLLAAIIAYQEIKGVVLTEEQMSEVIIENNF